MVNITGSYTTFNADHGIVFKPQVQKIKGSHVWSFSLSDDSLKCDLVPPMTSGDSRNLNKNLINKCQSQT